MQETFPVPDDDLFHLEIDMLARKEAINALNRFFANVEVQIDVPVFSQLVSSLYDSVFHTASERLLPIHIITLHVQLF